MKATVFFCLSLGLLAMVAHCSAIEDCEENHKMIHGEHCVVEFNQIYINTTVEERNDPDLWCRNGNTLLECFCRVPCKMTPILTYQLNEIMQKYSPTCELNYNISGCVNVSEGNETSANISNVQVVDLKAEYLGGEQVLVTWNVTEGASNLDGFNVTYRVFIKKPLSPYMFQEVEPSVNEDGLFSVVLNVAKKSRYEIQVTPYNSEMEAAPSDPIYFYVSGVPLGVTPEISVTATSLGSDSAVVSYAVLGNRELSSVNFFYKTEDGNKWTQVTKDAVPLRGDEFLVLTGLEPDTVYYIYAKSWLHTSYHVSITTVLIGDGQKTEEIGNLPLSKTQNGEGDISIDWSSWNLEDVGGYKVTATLNNTSTSTSRTEVQYLPSLQTTIEFAAGEETVDSVTVQPFDVYGLKAGGRILCQTPAVPR